MRASPLERLLRRDRLILASMLALLTLAAAAYTVAGVGMRMSALEMTAMAGAASGGMMMAPPQWTPAYAALVFLMWWVMMVAMMTPAASPVVLLYAALRRRSAPAADVAAAAAAFVAGYLAVWAAFSLVATLLQWLFELRGWVSPTMMTATTQTLGGAILLAAGLYQFTPLKHACLQHCRQPADFLARRRRRGPLLMGVEHGAFCLGCCWFLMALLFFGGIMNLYWIVGLALFVLLEKLTPYGHRLAQVAGAALAVWGAGLLGAAAGLLPA